MTKKRPQGVGGSRNGKRDSDPQVLVRQVVAPAVLEIYETTEFLLVFQTPGGAAHGERPTVLSLAQDLGGVGAHEAPVTEEVGVAVGTCHRSRQQKVDLVAMGTGLERQVLGSIDGQGFTEGLEPRTPEGIMLHPVGHREIERKVREPRKALTGAGQPGGFAGDPGYGIGPEGHDGFDPAEKKGFTVVSVSLYFAHADPLGDGVDHFACPHAVGENPVDLRGDPDVARVFPVGVPAFFADDSPADPERTSVHDGLLLADQFHGERAALDGLAGAEVLQGKKSQPPTDYKSQLKDFPHPQVDSAFGLRISKPLPDRPSSKWISEPAR